MAIFKKDYSKIADENLLRLIVQQDELAFEALYERYKIRLYRYFIRMCGNETQAQDLLQDLFLRLFQKADLYEERYKFSTWIYTMAYRLFINQVRKKSFNRMVTEENIQLDNTYTSDDVNTFESALEHKFFKEKLDVVLQTFDAEKFNTFILRFQQGLNVSEIADIMECPVGTVKSRLHYTIKEISHQMAAYKEI